VDTAAERLLAATAHLPTPRALIDAEPLWANAADLVRRADGVPIRVASKSVRVRSIVEGTLALDGFAGVMAYSLAEANWLVDHGITDVLLAYPTVDASALQDLIADERRLAAITVMVDSVEGLDVIDALLPVSRPEIRLCLDVDASLRLGPFHLGVRRSPVRSTEDAQRLAQTISGRAGYRLVGLMFYDAQIAGLPDTSRAVRMMKRRSAAELVERRGQVVEAVRHVAPLELVNAGGTGSLEVTGGDPAITELTAGSGLFCPTLFDHYDAFEARPAAFYALSVVRRPADDIATLYAGGYIASGRTDHTRRPTPAWPEGLELIDSESAGEVQTPVKGDAARDLRIGDRVLMRHAKAGEMCERFNSVAIVDADGRVDEVPTYRGEGQNFG
jgi:D-serine deaminase-like pyridoxal phosphate-dependent protein